MKGTSNGVTERDIHRGKREEVRRLSRTSNAAAAVISALEQSDSFQARILEKRLHIDDPEA